MRVLFLYPNKVMTTRIPFGVSYLSSYLKKDGHQVGLFDTTFIKCSDIKNDEELRASSLQVRNPDLKKYGLIGKDTDVLSEFESQLELFKPDIIAASVVDPNYHLCLELLRRAKEKYKEIITIAGGPTPTFSPQEVITEDCVDIICIGEGEEAIVELCNKIERNEDTRNIKNMWVKINGTIYKNGIRPLLDVNKLLLPDWDIFDQRHLLRPLGGKVYRMGIFSMTRGCLFRCKYCGNFALSRLYQNGGVFYRIRNPDILIREIALYKEKYKLEFIFFIDDIFPLHKPEVLDEFCLLYKRDVGLPFNISLHPELITEDAFAKIVDAGCRNVCIGLESGSQEIRKRLLGRVYTNAQVVRVFNLARKYKIRSSSFNIIGLPYETRNNIFETIELNRRAKPTSATISFFQPYRGSELRDLCIKEKLFDPFQESILAHRADSYLKLPQISNNELLGLFKTFQLYIKLPKIFYGLIYIAEGDSLLARVVMGILKQIFYRITDKESKWDFTKNRKDSYVKNLY